MRHDPGGNDMLDYVRELLENHPESDIAEGVRKAIYRAADAYQDGAPDAGAPARLCTHIAALAAEPL